MKPRVRFMDTRACLIETLDGRVVSSQAENDQFNPASNLKLATALVALQTFGPSHRFSRRLDRWRIR